MSTSLFELDDGRFRPTELATGPWSPSFLHGGPVGALLAHHLDAGSGAGEMFPARFTLELLRPVDHQPMDLAVEVVRPGRKVQVLEAHLSLPQDPSTVVARATLQQIRRAPIVLPANHRELDPLEPPPHLPDDLPTPDPAMRPDDPPAFHNRAVEHRTTDGFFDFLGPAFDWIHVVVDLLPNTPLSPLARVAAAADFGNGVSATLPSPEYQFINPDLTIVLTDLPGDEWVGIDARTRVSDHGVGYAESVVYGRQGRIGRSIQSLLIDRAG